jgi:hypothetical protein
MPSPPATDPLVRLARRAGLWTIGPVALLLRAPLTELAHPVQCAGALDVISIIVARIRPDLRVGALFGTLQALALTLAFGLFAELAERTSGSAVIALAMTITLAISRPFSTMFAPPWMAAAFAACAGVALSLHRCFCGRVPPRRCTIVVIAMLILAAATVTAWMFSSALAAMFVIRHRPGWRSKAAPWIATAITAATVVVVPLLLTKIANPAGVVTSWQACRVGGLPGDRLHFPDTFGAAGPLIWALAALGAFASATAAGVKSTAVIVALLILASLPGLADEWPAHVALAPAIFGMWTLAAVGTRELLAYRPRRGATVTAAMAIAAVPLLQLSRVQEPSGFRHQLLGHDRATLAEMRRLLNVIPDGSTVVDEDASVDVLLRAALVGGRRSKTLSLAPLARHEVLDALTRSPVFAFPAGQRELGLRGFAIDPVAREPDGAAQPLAAVSALRACVELGAQWTDLNGVGEHGRVTLVADDEPARGPAVLYFSGTNAYTPGPDSWPFDAMPGFDLRIFDRTTSERLVLMEAEAADAGLLHHPVFDSPYVARLRLFRTRQAPLALPIVLGPPRPLAVGRRLDAGEGRPSLMVCDAPPGHAAEF